jgi:wobble nucleotide-excising tRNase
MIEAINISRTATYGNTPETLSGLAQFNFLFGSNGSGKTTIGRIIADESNFPYCQVIWKGGTKLQPMVYNHDFIDRNFNQSKELKGVFTLGEKQVDTLAEIEREKKEQDVLIKEIENLTKNLQGSDGKGGKKGELEILEDELKKKCWIQKQKYDVKFQDAFEGYRNNSKNFKDKILQELNSNTSTLLSLEELEKKADSIFGKTPTTASTIPNVDAANLLTHESNLILKKRVIGKEDVDIAAMIKKLGNSDWVREGRTFYDVNNEVCPFCQQSTTDAFTKSLNDYFDESFATDSKSIDNLATNYATDGDRLLQQLSTIITSSSKFLDVEKLKLEKELLDTKIALNNQRLAEKKREASRIIELEPLGNIIAAINTLINSTNTQIKAHNNIVANFAKERSALTAQVWMFVLEELKADLDNFKITKNNLETAIQSLTLKIKKANEEMQQKTTKIRELEKQTSSVQPTIDGINALLISFGFQGFKLAKASTGTSYKLVRSSDGTDAKATLSEGEKTFVTFLYFYHLLKGSELDSGMTTDRIVVFDDPVSSLDSDILFIVSSLIKGLFEEVRDGKGHIKQLFILTHNVYFHKEVTFNPKRSNNKSMRDESFWIVRKSDHISKIEKHDSNPIKTSYELLWTEVRRQDRSNLTIQNTLRRILENYFKILGDVDPDKICALFSGKEKLICKTLFSWVNDGSHFAHDDLYVSIDSSLVETYLKVFREIFKKSDHFAHYKMMMGDAFIEEANVDDVVSDEPAMEIET